MVLVTYVPIKFQEEVLLEHMPWRIYLSVWLSWVSALIFKIENTSRKPQWCPGVQRHSKHFTRSLYWDPGARSPNCHHIGIPISMVLIPHTSPSLRWGGPRSLLIPKYEPWGLLHPERTPYPLYEWRLGLNPKEHCIISKPKPLASEGLAHAVHSKSVQ